MKRRLAAMGVALLATLLPASPVAAYIDDTYPNNYATQQPNIFACVAASSVTWMNTITSGYGGYGWNSSTVTSFYNYGVGKNNYNYIDPHAGIDPRGWAWIMFHYSPPNYTFNDYRYSSQGTADTEIVYGIRYTGQAVGALVDKGNHAFLVTGFKSTFDPNQPPYDWSLQGFYIVDPWYHAAGDGHPASNDWSQNGGAYNLTPDYFLTTSLWDSDYFLKYKNTYAYDSNGDIATVWDTYYVLVLRKDSNTQAPTGFGSSAPPYADSRIPGSGPAAMVVPNSGSLEAAVTDGVVANNLVDDSRLAIPLDHVQVTDKVFVQSLDPGISNYILATLTNASGVAVALAVVTQTAQGYQLGAIRGVGQGFHLPTAEIAAGALGVAASTTSAVWRPSADAPTPFDAIWTGRDGSGHSRTISLRGQVGVQP